LRFVPPDAIAVPASIDVREQVARHNPAPVYEHAAAIPETGTGFSLLWMPAIWGAMPTRC
jgi:hypothetical protein